jgi:hypothetical protein
MKPSPVAFVLAFALSSPFALAGAPQPHRRPWPIENGHNHQPTQQELEALHMQDVTPDQAREIDRLYEQLLSGNEKLRNRHPAD